MRVQVAAKNFLRMWLQIEFKLIDSFRCGEWTHNGYKKGKSGDYCPI